MTGGLIAPLIASATLLGSNLLWYRGLTDVRIDPPALFLFWTGALFLLGDWRSERWRPSLAGLGIGLVSVAALVNPKWPFESVILGGVYVILLYRTFRARPAAIVPMIGIPLLCAGGTLAFITSAATLRDYVFFTFRYNMAMGSWFAARPDLYAVTFAGGRPFLECDAAFKGVLPVAALLIVPAIAFAPLARRQADVRSYRILLALALAAFLEIRFVFPYPNLWTQYYLQWSFILALIYGVTAAEIVSRTRGALAPVTIAVIAVVLLCLNLPSSSSSRGPAHWPLRSALQRQLRPGETVWLETPVHPIGAPDASYCWFSFDDLTPFSLDYAARHPDAPLPRLTDRDLPVCRAERGLEPHLRFVSGGGFIEALPETKRCLARMIASGRAVPWPANSVWELRR